MFLSQSASVSRSSTSMRRLDSDALCLRQSKLRRGDRLFAEIPGEKRTLLPSVADLNCDYEAPKRPRRRWASELSKKDLHAGATTIIARSNTKLTAPIVSDGYATGFSRTYEATPEVTRKVMRAIIRFIPFLSGVSYMILTIPMSMRE
jgi:hypothetical protein